ncbi:MAG: N-acetylmuramoyl-L-alanine amidase-like domain-containing protein [Gemmatimonadota bacterium]|nr:N-acetylmuramoyl-L-alanine amidase-like domain-containing protein [Gemmatimonadota bacterium]
MGRMMEYRGLLGPFVVLLLFAAAVLWSPFEPHRPPVDTFAGAEEHVGWLDEDWQIFEAKVQWALEVGTDTLPVGAAMAEIGRSFVGTAYVPRTLEVEGPERVVVNFRGLDCVTFVENVFALSRFVRSGAGRSLTDRPAAEAHYQKLLEEIRYRDGQLDGYQSRLHYFSDWIANNASRMLIRDLGAELEGIHNLDRIDFMTTHVDSYSQLANFENLEALRETEERLSAAGRLFVPEARIPAVADHLEDGDIIAATSVVEGLDVAHTGLALWVEGTLRLMHAPLVGDSVQISEVTLAERIQRIEGQDGIIVARPLDR